MSKGIDISTYNTVNDWNAVKKSVSFAILKIIRADGNPDNKFASHLSGCRSHGIPVQGVYNYSYATSTNKAVADARKVIDIMRANNLIAGVWLDIEDECMKKLGTKLIDIIYAYKGEIEREGFPFGIYTGLNFYNNYLKPYQDSLVGIPMWIARYPNTSPMNISQNPNDDYKPNVPNICAWQYSSKGKVPGISGNVDLNEFYADLPTETPVVVVANKYFPKYTGNTTSIITGLMKIGEKDTSFAHRKKIAKANGMPLYVGSARQNTTLLNLLKQGKLIRA